MKKAIKIALIILLVASMLFVLTGCGKEEKENTATENKTVTEEQTTEESKTEFSMGEWKDNTYENEFLGIKFNLPEGWIYSSDEEIAEMMDISIELLNDDQKKFAELAKLTGVYYAVANNPNTGDSVMILSEKPLMELTTEFYLDKFKSELEAQESISFEIGETSKEKVAGREYDTVTATASISGIDLMEKYYVYKMDKYFVGIIAASTSGETGIDNIMKSFE